MFVLLAVEESHQRAPPVPVVTKTGEVVVHMTEGMGVIRLTGGVTVVRPTDEVTVICVRQDAAGIRLTREAVRLADRFIILAVM